MHIFALETNTEKLKKKFLSANEQEIMTIFFHGFHFFMKLSRDVIYTVILIAIMTVIDSYADVNPLWTSAGALIIWFFFIFVPLLRAYLDWRFDFILLTTDKLIIVDQSSLFRQKITPMNMENFASVSAETQFLNLFPFGILHFDLKEGTGRVMNLKYVPNVQEVVSRIADTITLYQRKSQTAAAQSQVQAQ